MRWGVRLAPVVVALVLMAHVPSTAGAGFRALHRLPPPQTVLPSAIHIRDGDTFSVGRVKIRLRGIDTPELGAPRGRWAARRLAELLREGPVTIIPRAEDVYGRIVADVYVGGQDVSRVLAHEGFVKPKR